MIAIAPVPWTVMNAVLVNTAAEATPNMYAYNPPRG